MTVRVAVLTIESSVLGFAETYPRAICDILSPRQASLGVAPPEGKPHDANHDTEPQCLDFIVTSQTPDYTKSEAVILKDWVESRTVDWIVIVGGGVVGPTVRAYSLEVSSPSPMHRHSLCSCSELQTLAREVLDRTPRPSHRAAFQAMHTPFMGFYGRHCQ